MEKEIDKNAIIRDFEKKKIRTFYDVPEKLRNDKQIIRLQRKHAHRISKLRGYDVISKEFFVEEDVAYEKKGKEFYYDNLKTIFSTFDEYYAFLDGDIYENACYYQFVFSDDIIEKYNLNKEKIKSSVEFDETVSDLKSNLSERKQKYRENKRLFHLRKQWVDKFNKATTYDEFLIVLNNYQKKHSYHNINFYIWNYITMHGEDSFGVIIKYLSSKSVFEKELLYALCFFYGAEKVISNFKYRGMSKSSNVRHNAELRKFATEFKNKKYTIKEKTFFDIKSGYYCIKTEYREENQNKCRPSISLYRYFETIDELSQYLNADFSNCDFRDAFELQKEKISKYNENTIFPITSEKQLKKIISKGYNRISKNFFVIVHFYTEENEHYHSEKRIFDYFFEFVFFLKNDLSEADLIFCDGLCNLTDVSNLNFKNAKILSSIKEKIGVCLETTSLNIETKKYNELEKNENETHLILQNSRKELSEVESEIKDDKIYYITDLHLEHRIIHANCRTKEDCIYVIQKIVDNLLDDIEKCYTKKELVLIGGDTASSFSLFKCFVMLLKKTIKEKNLSICVLFVLGNHELWDFPKNNLDDIVNMYRGFLEENGMYLLQNETICVLDEGIKYISLEGECSELKQARAILFGGIGFSGDNEEFNAKNGIYRNTISRTIEKEESEKIRNAYLLLCQKMPKEKVVVLTHMPFKDWCGQKKRNNNYIYISGHNHRNEYYDDGMIRIYSDNQVGYTKRQARLKYFYFSYEFDLFEDYSDGIYEITREEYCDFYRGKRIECNFNNANKIYMLKKQGYYCFIHENKSGRLSILNGGGKKQLLYKDINYYYANMDKVILFLKSPFDEYCKAQQQISSMIKKIGGTGDIHGAIIDIDFFNHIYLNPIDFSITPYYATDIIYKRVYSDLGKLLKDNCPIEYYNNYKLLLDSAKGEIVLKTGSPLVKGERIYLETDIYFASREIKKMQKLNSNRLTIWLENASDNQIEQIEKTE